jgi:thioredoxin reductase (NADPH)
MTDGDPPTKEPAPSPPVVLVVDADQAEREASRTGLHRRFGAAYEILTADSAETGLAVRHELARQGREVALVAADLELPGLGGVAFLEQARARHRSAWRALLLAMDERGTRVPFGALEAIQRATALGRIDLWVLKGGSAPEEIVYPHIQEALTAWTKATHARHEVLRVVGEQWSPRSHELRDRLARNTVPFGFYPVDSKAGSRLLREYDVDRTRLPAVILHDGTVLHDPSLPDVAAALGVHTQPSSADYDLVILGAGPAGLAAAVNSSSEGLRTLVVEAEAIGGQAGTSSLIRNYLGFPQGLSGSELTFRAFEQNLLFGTEFVFAQRATDLAASADRRVVTLAEGSRLVARAVVMATGVTYRRLGIPALERLTGMGGFYGAAGVEAPAMVGEEVYVIGGANSAGQAALHLAKFARRVTLLVRGISLRVAMSDYLIKQIAATPTIEVRLHTRVVDGHGQTRLEGLTLKDGRTGQQEQVAAAAVFVMIGAEPGAEWLPDAIQRDPRGFILTGGDILRETWPLERRPLPFETSLPGVFAVGDVRSGSVKRVAGAVGEGSVALGAIHRYLTELAPVPARAS